PNAPKCPHCGEPEPAFNLKCPKCGSTRFIKHESSFSAQRAFLTMALIGPAGAVAGARKETWYECQSCGKTVTNERKGGGGGCLAVAIAVAVALGTIGLIFAMVALMSG